MLASGYISEEPEPGKPLQVVLTIVGDDDPPYGYSAELNPAKVTAEDRAWVEREGGVGLRFMIEDDGQVVFDRSVWTAEELAEIDRRATELQAFFDDGDDR